MIDAVYRAVAPLAGEWRRMPWPRVGLVTRAYLAKVEAASAADERVSIRFVTEDHGARWVYYRPIPKGERANWPRLPKMRCMIEANFRQKYEPIRGAS